MLRIINNSYTHATFRFNMLTTISFKPSFLRICSLSWCVAILNSRPFEVNKPSMCSKPATPFYKLQTTPVLFRILLYSHYVANAPFQKIGDVDRARITRWWKLCSLCSNTNGGMCKKLNSCKVDNICVWCVL